MTPAPNRRGAGPLRILWILSKLDEGWGGGVGRVVEPVCRELARRGHEVHVAGNSPTGRVEPVEGVETHAWPPRRRKEAQIGPVLRTVRRLAPDLVHFHSALPHGSVILPLLVLRRWLGAPRVVVTPHTGNRADYTRRFSRAPLRHADGVIAPSVWSARQAIAAGAPPERTLAIENGVEVPGRVEFEGRAPLVVAIGRLVESKGIDVLVRAFDRVAGDHPGWRLELVGGGRERGALEALVRRARHTDGIRLAGERWGPAKRELLARAAIGVVPSRADNCPGSLLEFHASGVASVATTVGGIPELCEGGRIGRLVEPDDPEGLAGALGALMAGPAERVALARAAHQASAARAWPQVAARYEQAYRSLMARRPLANAGEPAAERPAPRG